MGDPYKECCICGEGIEKRGNHPVLYVSGTFHHYCSWKCFLEEKLFNERKALIIDNLINLWSEERAQRFGQLLENYVFKSGERGDETSKAMFYQEDFRTLQNLKEENK